MKKDGVMLNPYLMFNGNCAEAMKFYQSVFGGELKMQTYGETKAPVADNEKNKIMHASLRQNMLSFMGSDGTTDRPVAMGNNIQMAIMGENDEELRKYFSGLSVGGKIQSPLKKESWGDTFGMLIDKFGIHWMVNITAPKNGDVNKMM
jgi:PhnB protein